MGELADAVDGSGKPRALALTAVWREDRWFVLAVSSVILMVQLVGSFLLPLFEVPDERHHTDLVAVASDHAGHGWQSGRTRLLDEGIVALTKRYHAERAASSAMPRDERPPLIVGEAAQNRLYNYMVKHPPLYYITVDVGEGFIDRMWPGRFTGDQEVMIYRWISALFLVPVPLLCMAAARILGADRDTYRVAGLLPVMIPGLVLRNGALVNNDALLILTTGVAVVAALEIARGGGRMVSLVGGFAAGLAVLTKLFGWVAVPCLALAFIVSRRHRSWRDVVRSASVCGAGVMLVGGWFWVRNLLLYGAPFVIINAREPVDGFVPDWGFWTMRVVRSTWSGFWGAGFAVPSTPGYRPWLVTATAIVVVLTVVPLLRRGSGVGMRWIAAMPLVGMLLLGYGWQAFRYPIIGKVAGVQGRYFYVAVVGFLPLAAIGLRSVLRRPRRVAPFIAVLALFSVASSTWLMLKRYWGPPDASFAERLQALQAWSPVWSLTPWILAVAAVAAWAWMASVSLRGQSSFAERSPSTRRGP